MSVKLNPPKHLPVLADSRPLNLRRPVWGSAEVESYGAVGLAVKLEAATPDPPSGPTSVQLKRNEPLPLVGDIVRHKVGDVTLWIGIEDAALLVSTPDEDELLAELIAGRAPSELVARLWRYQDIDEPEAWNRVGNVIGRLAVAGFVDGVRGYRGEQKIAPHRFARFHLTNRCNLECIHCYTGSSPRVPREDELSVERWISLVEDFAAHDGEEILFTGGEALVYPGCIDVMKRAHELGLKVTLFSNGILVPRHIDAIAEYANAVQVSLDGPTAESHDMVRGPGSFKKAIAAIRALLDRGVETRVSTTIMAENWDAVREGFPRLVEQFAGTAIRFRISYGAMTHGRGEELEQGQLDEAATRAWVDKLLTKIPTHHNRAEGPNAIKKFKGCGYAEQLVVAHNGLVFPCHLMSGALGHIDDIAYADMMGYLVKTAEAFDVDHRQGCGTCDLRNLCGGSCRVEDEKHTGSRRITTCTPSERKRKLAFLAQRYRPVAT